MFCFNYCGCTTYLRACRENVGISTKVPWSGNLTYPHTPCTNTHRQTDTQTHTHKHTSTHTQTHKHKHTSTHTQTHTQAHTQTHTHTPTSRWSGNPPTTVYKQLKLTKPAPSHSMDWILFNLKYCVGTPSNKLSVLYFFITLMNRNMRFYFKMVSGPK